MESKKQIFRVLIISATVSGLALLYFFADARHSDFFPRCIFFSITGLYCPGCGSQRAVSALLHGDFRAAIHYNVLLAASLPLLIYSAYANLRTTIYWIIRDFGEKRTTVLLDLFKPGPVHQKIFYSPVFVKAFLAVVVLFWILRNIPVFPFNLLAPV